MSGSTLTALNAELTSLKPGLKPIPLVSESYQLASVPASATRLLNCYAERMPAGSRSPFIIKPTPGLSVLTTLGAGPVLASASIGRNIFFISGDHAWRMADDGNPPTDLGYVGTPSGTYELSVTIALGLNSIVFCVPPRAYAVEIFFGTSVTELTTEANNFPDTGAESVCYIDGYYVFAAKFGQSFFLSKLLDATTFDSLDYTSISTTSDFIQRVVTHNGELWLFNASSIQVWYDTGNADAPFRPRAGGVIPHGIGSNKTIVELDGSLFFLGVDKVVYRTQGYQALRVSDHALEEALADYDGGYLRDLSACGFMHNGHAFYAIALPKIGTTFVYDCETKLWHERSSSADGNGRWVVNTASQLGARLLMGDGTNGNVYHHGTLFTTDNSVQVLREATLPALVTHGKREFMNRLEVEMEVGTYGAPQTVSLDWSDDGGLNWRAAPRTLGTGDLGATKTRVATTRLGAFRQRVLRLRANAPMTIYGVDADITPGSD